MLWILGACGALLVAGAAYRKRSLSFSGMIAAFVMGTVYFGAGNAFWFGILLLFFISSSLLSKLHHENKAELELTYDKTGTRDAGQVFANGGMGMMLVLLNAVYPLELWGFLFIGVMATVTSDTWATEIGTLAKKPPRSVLTGKVLPAGNLGRRIAAGHTCRCSGRSADRRCLLAASGGFRNGRPFLPAADAGRPYRRTRRRIRRLYPWCYGAADEPLHCMRPRGGGFSALRPAYGIR